MEKLIPNSDSTSKKLVEKVWVKESFGKKKLRVGQEDKNDKQSFYGVRVRGVTIVESFVIWSLWHFRRCFKSFRKCFMI